MEPDNPEKRIADLERQLAERQPSADLPPASPDHTAASRQFVASPPFFGSKWTTKRSYILVYSVPVVLLVAMFTLPYVAHSAGMGWKGVSEVSTITVFGVLVIFLVGYLAYYLWYSRRKILIGVTSNGLTVSQRPGDVFSFSDARLGQWAFGMSMGSALHLRSGPHTFVLGGRDHRVASGTRLEAPPASTVDAWLWASDFDELLAMIGRRYGFEVRGRAPGEQVVRGPAPGEPTRCLLFPNPEFMSVQPAWAFLRVQRMARSFQSPRQPSFAIDVGADAIWVVDPNVNMLKASAWLAQVTAAPEVYVLFRPWGTLLGWIVRFIPDEILRLFWWTTPVLVVRVPGLEPLSIGCRDSTAGVGTFMVTGTVPTRFSWHGKIPKRINEPADYVVSSPDWLTLVGKFGLAPYLQDSRNQVRG